MPPNRCVVQDCDNKADTEKGISIHSCPKASSLKNRWISFVRIHRDHFNPTGVFVVCSEHFSPDCFERTVHIPVQRRFLKPGSVPSVWKKNEDGSPVTDRKRRRVSSIALRPWSPRAHTFTYLCKFCNSIFTSRRR